MPKKSVTAICLSLLLALPLLAADTPATTAGDTTMPADGNVFLVDKAGKHALDPVCGMRIVADDKSIHADYDGKRYYLCSDGCDKAFTAKPAEYVANMVLPANVLALSGDKMMVMCSVSDERVAVNDKTPHQVYEGKDYFFCCDKCPVKFAKKPEKYAAADAAKAPKEGMKMEKKEHKGDKEHEGHDHH